MKILSLLLLIFLLSDVSSAQNLSGLSDAPDVAVVQKNWRRDVRNPALEEDPFRANNEQAALERTRAEQKQIPGKLREIKPPEPAPLPDKLPDTAAPGTRVTYIYSVKIRNTGTKTIRTVVWEYVFFDPETQNEVGRRHYTSRVKIQPGKSGDLVARSALPPSNVVRATKKGKEPQDQYSEQVVIQRLEFTDDTAWQRPNQ